MVASFVEIDGIVHIFLIIFYLFFYKTLNYKLKGLNMFLHEVCFVRIQEQVDEESRTDGTHRNKR